VPQHRLHLANLPTPLYRVDRRDPHDDLFTLYVKRDDATGAVELGGNKIRKLEFLLADALQKGCDSVVTIGGQQSNHCRATAAAARMLGMEPHLILRRARTKQANHDERDEEDLGLTGNLLIDRMVGSKIYTCTPGEYGRVGSSELVLRLCAHLKETGRRPYAIPVGGSNGLGSWGYINGVEELLIQWDSLEGNPSLDHIVFACGSGGTAAGIALGIALAHTSSRNKIAPTVHAIGVCDDEDYFYRFVASIADQMGFQPPSAGTTTTEDFVRQHLVVHQGKGLGYAVSTEEELDFVMSFARETGIVLDPVYSGKALFNFFQFVRESDPDAFRGQNVLFWHTGGALGLYDKCDDLLPTLKQESPCQRLDVYGKGTGLDLSSPTSTDTKGE